MTGIRFDRRTRLAARLDWTLRGAGFGPASDRIDRFAWALAVHARTTGGHDVRLEVHADGHPSYVTTATMLGEAGALLAEPAATPQIGG